MAHIRDAPLGTWAGRPSSRSRRGAARRASIRIDFTGADFQYFDSLLEFNHDTLNQELQLSGTALDL